MTLDPYQRARAAGLDHESALAEARLSGQQQRAAVAPVPVAETPRELSMTYSDRHAVELDRTLDPRRAAQDRAEEQRDQAELDAIDAQIAPLRQQRAVVANRIARRRFQG